jgi:hypothetical protein
MPAAERPAYGVYEMMNSTANNRVTRLMALYKDWQVVNQIGNIRSTRPTNILLALEWNAILIHDGGPFYNDAYFTSTGINHLSGSFSRVRNGKAIPIVWVKASETGITRYYDAKGAEITLNAGKTYVGICPSDDWSSVLIG